MGTPREYMLEANGDAIGYVVDRLRTREANMDDLDMAQAIISDFDASDLVVVRKSDWMKRSRVFDAMNMIVGLLKSSGDDDLEEGQKREWTRLWEIYR